MVDGNKSLYRDCKYASLLISVLARDTISNINPRAISNSPTTANALARTAVGNLSTKPFLANSITIGTPRAAEEDNVRKANQPKNVSGLLSLRREIKVRSIFQPSLKVRNLLFDPSGLSL